MKKLIIAVIFTVIIAMGLTACDRTVENNETEAKTENYITEEEAKNKALAHAKIEGAEVTYTRVDMNTKDDRQVYEVEFYYDEKEYDYEIDALSGEIVSYINETEGRNAENAGVDIGEEAARELILEKAEGAAAEDIVIERNMNDGQIIYEGTVTHEGKTYEFEIDAVNGTISKWE